MNQSQQERFAPRRGLVANVVIGKQFVFLLPVLLVVPLGISALLHPDRSHAGVTFTVTFLVVAALVAGFAVWRSLRICLLVDTGSATLTVVNFWRRTQVRAGELVGVEPGEVVTRNRRQTVTYSCATLRYAPSGSQQQRTVQILASLRQGPGTPLRDALDAFCSAHGVPSTLGTGSAADDDLSDPFPEAHARPIAPADDEGPGDQAGP